VPEVAEATGAGWRSSELAELGAGERGQKDQIELGEVVEHFKADPSTTSPVPERAGGGQEKAAMRRRSLGSRARGGEKGGEGERLGVHGPVGSSLDLNRPGQTRPYGPDHGASPLGQIPIFFFET
jgi:hypothetical protein